jgi:hypothetical protein
MNYYLNINDRLACQLPFRGFTEVPSMGPTALPVENYPTPFLSDFQKN